MNTKTERIIIKNTPRIDPKLQANGVLFGIVKAKGKDSLRVSKGDSKSHFGIDTQGLDIEHVEVGRPYEFTIAIRTYIGRDLSIKTKIYAIDFEELDMPELLTDEELNKFGFAGEVVSSMKTDIKGLYVLEVIRFVDGGSQFKGDTSRDRESYRIRYFVEGDKPLHPELGKYDITFALENTSNQILQNGDVYKAQLSRTYEKEGQEFTSTSLQYIPCLSILELKKWSA